MGRVVGRKIGNSKEDGKKKPREIYSIGFWFCIPIIFYFIMTNNI